MKKSSVRLKSIEIFDFKNVEHGYLDFEGNRPPHSVSILGLYGQNGSGKTALIEAISLLKYALSGQPFPANIADFINVGRSLSRLKYEFTVRNRKSGAIDTVMYEFCIRREQDVTEKNTEESSIGEIKYKVSIFDEVLSSNCNAGSKRKRMHAMIDTRESEIFLPQTNYLKFVGRDSKTKMGLIVAKKITEATSRSFIFSREMLNVLRENCADAVSLALIEQIVLYGNFELFIINTSNSGLISLSALLPLSFRYSEGDKKSVGNIVIPLTGLATIPKEAVEITKKVFRSMNVVLSQIVPGLTISIKELGAHARHDGTLGERIQLMSNKNGVEIPLKYESEGIKKIISVLHLLIVVYNDPTITVAIDELDAGIFEYLLGELLSIIGEKGKGQLIFTSHNLRPLETLDKSFIAFTTTDPSKRYTRLANIKATNNLRNIYYRDIILGEESESLYEATNNYEIALAFREAGELSGS